MLPSFRRVARFLTAFAFAFVFALPSSPIRAEDEPAPPEPRGHVDVVAHLGPLESELEQHRRAPGYDGHDGVLLAVWKEQFKRRIGRMQRRVRDLGKMRSWVTEPETDEVLGLVPEKWSPFVRTLSALHTELGTCADGYRRATVNGGAAMRRWLKRNPGPEPIGRVPSRDALDDIERTILEYKIQGYVVPASLWEARLRMIALVSEEEERWRERNRRAYDEARHAAREQIEQSVGDTRRRLDEIARALTDAQLSLRTLVADAQRIEEERLERILAGMPEDPKRAAEVEKHFEKMRNSRVKARNFAGKRLARYGAEVQQGWMLPRSKLLKLIG